MTAAHHLARAQACLDDAEDARLQHRSDLVEAYQAMARTHRAIAAAVMAGQRAGGAA